ncbi:DUF6663 family protein [Haladaptatus sp. DJG-WS-42]|uniref:DUF6663 family protein n=1 Tax=Haladaptatus sp. DJG-WS-42 TaxID=3120516 RepID=UPI0030CB40C6
MQVTTNGTFRVLESTREERELLLLDVDSYDPTYVTVDATVADLKPGYTIEATVEWEDGTPRVTDVSVLTETLFEFVDGATNIFEAAQDTWQEGESMGEGMNSTVTYSTDNEPNGVVYTFAKQAGERDIFSEFRDGITPLEPLVERLEQQTAPPYEVFVLNPEVEQFVIVYLCLDKGGMLADTVRDTYDCPRR